MKLKEVKNDRGNPMENSNRNNCSSRTNNRLCLGASSDTVKAEIFRKIKEDVKRRCEERYIFDNRSDAQRKKAWR